MLTDCGVGSCSRRFEEFQRIFEVTVHTIVDMVAPSSQHGQGDRQRACWTVTSCRWTLNNHNRRHYFSDSVFMHSHKTKLTTTIVLTMRLSYHRYFNLGTSEGAPTVEEAEAEEDWLAWACSRTARASWSIDRSMTALARISFSAVASAATTATARSRTATSSFERLGPPLADQSPVCCLANHRCWTGAVLCN